jgi:DNA invertase Pin-like site-specific DNA recombinase
LEAYGCERIFKEQVSSIAEREQLEAALNTLREGIAKAKAEGKYKGRKPTAQAKTDMVKLALDQGVSKAQICRDLQISKTSLYRIIGGLRA